MKIVAGGYYITAGGQKVGPMEVWSESVEHSFRVAGMTYHFTSGGDIWRVDGSSNYCGKSGQIVALWSEGPVRTVTRQEIIPGTYDGVEVGDSTATHVDVNLRVKGLGVPPVHMNADQLDRAAAVLTALAGALRDGK